MLAIKHILFPIDFSERCCGAAPFVESFARRYDAKVTLLSVAQPFYYTAMGDPGGLVAVDTDELLRNIEARLGHALTQKFSGLRVDRVAQLGEPAREIVEFAQSNAVDLIMMPTHGYGPFRSLLLGSVTAKVLHDAQCPVWTAAHVAEPPSREHVSSRNILCAVDGTPGSLALMKWAGAFAADAGGAFRLIHVVPGEEGFQSRQMDREFELDMAAEARQTIQVLQDSAGVKAPLAVTAGNVAERICDEASRQDTDLIVIGRGAMHATLGRLRTHAYSIIRRSPAPVISV